MVEGQIDMMFPTSATLARRPSAEAVGHGVIATQEITLL
jgi:hypothetical protein